jgi:hypothetical protein
MLDEVKGKWLSIPVSGHTSSEKTRNRKKAQADEWNTLLDEKLLAAYKEGKFKPTIVMASDIFEKQSTYKMTITMDKKAVDVFEKAAKEADKEVYSPEDRPSAPSLYEVSPKQIHLVLWIDKQSFYLRRSTVETVLQMKDPKGGLGIISGLPVQNQVSIASGGDEVGIMPGPPQMIDIPFDLDMALRDIGKKVTIEVPPGAVPFSTFMQSLFVKYQDQLHPIFNPVVQLRKANNTKRRSDIHAILNAVNQFMVDNKGVVPAVIPVDVPTQIAKNGVDLCSIVVPNYIAGLPTDPNINTGRPIAEDGCTGSYYTGYSISQSSIDSRITVSAPYAEEGEILSVTR